MNRLIEGDSSLLSMCASLLCLCLLCLSAVFGQTVPDQKAQAIISKAVRVMGGDRYLQVKNQVGKGRYTLLSEKGVISSQTFVDIVVLPDKERTDFKGGGTRTIQTNSGSTGWIYDSNLEVVKLQTPVQITNFKQSIRTSIDYLL